MNTIIIQGWQWLDETAFKYTNWAEGEPSLNGDEYCLELWTNGFWNDVACSGRKPYVCQKRSIHSFCAVPGPGEFEFQKMAQEFRSATLRSDQHR